MFWSTSEVVVGTLTAHQLCQPCDDELARELVALAIVLEVQVEVEVVEVAVAVVVEMCLPLLME